MISKYKKQLKEKSEVYLRIKVHPGASKSEIKGVMADETVKISISAPPEKGKANAELINFLAKEFGVNKSGVKILSGASDKVKLVKIVS